MEIAAWLSGLGLRQYEPAFRQNDIDASVLPNLTADDLVAAGVASVGHRRKLLDAIAALRAATALAENVARPTSSINCTSSAERRHLTVVFCDLIGSTALSTRLDPEDMRSVISAYHRCCAELVERNGGFVAKYMGDGILIYFGYPQAHEDDAERAVRAGLALAEAVPKLESPAESPLQVRVGIATGLVVVGDLIGAGSAQEQAVVGDTPNLAARLQALAEPGAVVISESTCRLTARLFEYRDLGTVALKGFTENVPAWQVQGPSVVESRFEALRATTTPLIGREEEIDVILRRWRQAKVGDGQVVLISGEPGIGKSRIAQTILERISGEAHTRLRYFCSPHHQDSALYPVITQLARAAGFQREDTPEQRLDKLEAVLAQGAKDLRQAAPLITDLLSIPAGERYPPLALSPQKRKEKTLRALLAQAAGLAARQPVLMLVEDIHWSDPTTRESLDLLIDGVPALRILVIITFRPEFTPPWVGRPRVTVITLSRLPARQSAEMITRVTGAKTLPKHIVDQIGDRTDGVPLFIEELTKSVVESGLVTATSGRYAVTEPVAPLAIPTTLHASLLARLDQLASAREIAQIAAAVGRSFSHELISAVAGAPPPQLEDALVQLMQAGLIFRRGMPPDAEYTFKHTLVQDAAYSTLLRSRRQQLHARIAVTLESQFPEIVTADPQLMARHWAEAGLNEKAIGYSLKAGQGAIARGAMTEAVAQLRKGLDWLCGILDGTARQELELDLQIALGNALLAIKGYAAPEPGEAFDRARQLCEQLDRPLQFESVLIGQYSFRVVRGELSLAEHHAAEMRNLCETKNDVRSKRTTSSLSGNISFYLGKFMESRAHFENALSLRDPVHRYFVPSPAYGQVWILVHLFNALLHLGYVDQARLRRDEAMTEARRRSPYTLASALSVRCIGDWAVEGMRSAQTMLRSAEEILTISSAQNFSLLEGFGNAVRGWCLGTMGQAAQGIPLIHQGLAIYSSTGAKLAMPFFISMLAETYGMAGQPERGLDRIAEAVTLIETTQERWAEAELHRLRGTLLLSIHQPAAAEAGYRQALAVARRQSAKFWELRAALDLARLWRDQGNPVEGHNLLAPIYGWFTEGFDTPVLQDARTLLEELAQ